MNREARKQRRTEHTRKEILEAAKRVFARAGIESATMQQIATEAGYGPSSLYNYFSSKEEILDAALDEIMEMATEAMGRPQAKDESFRSYFESLMHEQFQLAERNREYFSFMAFLRGIGPHHGCFSPQRFENAMTALSQVCQSGIKQGEFRLMDPVRAAHLIHGAARSALLLRYASKKPRPVAAEAKEFCEFVFHGLGRGN